MSDICQEQESDFKVCCEHAGEWDYKCPNDCPCHINPDDLFTEDFMKELYNDE